MTGAAAAHFCQRSPDDGSLVTLYRDHAVKATKSEGG